MAAALVTVLVWASAFVGIRSAGRGLSPGALSLGRLVVGLVVLTIVCLIRHERFPSRADLRPTWLALLPCGLLWFGVYNLTLNAGERRIDAGTAAMVVNVGPILIALLAGHFLHEGFPRNVLAGCAVAFSGVAIIALASATHTATTTGVLLCLTAAVAYAGGAVTQKVVLRRLSPLQTIWLCCAIGVLFFLPFAQQLATELGSAAPGVIGWTVYLGTFPTALGFLTWAFALSRSNVGRLGATTYLIPPLSVLLGWLLLGETPAPLAYLGGAICLCGSRSAAGGTVPRPRQPPVQLSVCQRRSRRRGRCGRFVQERGDELLVSGRNALHQGPDGGGSPRAQRASLRARGDSSRTV